ncbi:MAG: ribokinase [Rhodospirillales bacterium]|nr:ribokinase [Rhodospirillales bacterium]MCB9964710.1 ribokinase [Rhodospirillales bacterium]MCB9980066.1 ribokinase [Rhodospirillales bacterium]
MISSLPSKIGLPVLIDILGSALSRIDHPVAQGAAKALSDLEHSLGNGAISPEQLNELNRHTETLAQLKSEEYRAQISEINQSLRAEIASEDPYVRRMRPTFGYLMAVTWAAQMLALAWVILEDPSHAPLVMQAFESLGLIWTVGLSVLGIYVYKRSDDKKSLSSGLPGKIMPNKSLETRHISARPDPHPVIYNE